MGGVARALERLLPRRQKPDGGVERFAHRLRRDQVPDVHGIERPAEQRLQRGQEGVAVLESAGQDAPSPAVCG